MLKSLFLLAVALLCFNAMANTAYFTTNVTEGIAPLSVTFTNASSTGAVKFKWTFQNGKTSTATKSSKQTFLYPGIYNATLTAYFATDTQQYTSVIKVHPKDTTYQLPFFESFEDTVYPSANWSMYATDVNQMGEFYPGATYTVSGDYSSWISPATTFKGNTGNRLVSPKIKLAKMGNMLSFYIIQNSLVDYGSTVSVLVSATNAVNLTNFELVRTIYEYEISTDSFTRLEINLDKYAEHDVYIAFQINDYVEGEPWYIDDVAVNEIKKTVYSRFEVTPLSGAVPLTVNLSNNSAGNYNKINWNMGNGSTFNSNITSYTYTQPGKYFISLTVADNNSSDSTRYNNEINVYVDTITVKAAAEASVSYGICPLLVSFMNKSVNATNYLWNFGDNTTSTLENPEHTYTKPGKYKVNLVASNKYSSSAIELNQTIDILASINKVSLISGLIYPNPANNSITIKQCAEKVFIYDEKGNVVLNYNHLTTNDYNIIDISTLNEGIFFMEIFYQGKSSTVKFERKVH